MWTWKTGQLFPFLQLMYPDLQQWRLDATHKSPKSLKLLTDFVICWGSSYLINWFSCLRFFYLQTFFVQTHLLFCICIDIFALWVKEAYFKTSHCLYIFAFLFQNVTWNMIGQFMYIHKQKLTVHLCLKNLIIKYMVHIKKLPLKKL